MNIGISGIELGTGWTLFAVTSGEEDGECEDGEERGAGHGVWGVLGGWAAIKWLRTEKKGMINEEKLFEEVHEEEDGGDFAIDAFGFANGGVVGIADGAVGLDFADGGIVGVANGAVAFYLADGGIVGIADGAITIDLSYAGVVGVADGAVGIDFSDGGVVGIADGAVALNFSDGGIVGIAQGLGLDGRHQEEGKSEEKGKDGFHWNGCDFYLGPRLVVTRMAPLAPREP